MYLRCDDRVVKSGAISKSPDCRAAVISLAASQRVDQRLKGHPLLQKEPRGVVTCRSAQRQPHAGRASEVTPAGVVAEGNLVGGIAQEGV
jgi:hypothetical protein